MFLAIAFVALEEKLHINKEVPVLIAGGIGMILFFVKAPEIYSDLSQIPGWVAGFAESFGIHGHSEAETLQYGYAFGRFLHQLFVIGGLVLFLLMLLKCVAIASKHGAIKVVMDKIGLIDFKLFNFRVTSKNIQVLLIIIGGLSFIFSALLDNGATAIIMTIALALLIKDFKLYLQLLGYSVIANNAGGAWSVVGDGTSVELWVGGKVSPVGLAEGVFLFSLMAFIIAHLWYAIKLKNYKEIEFGSNYEVENDNFEYIEKHQWIMFFSLIGGILFIPLGKILFHAWFPAAHIPPFLFAMISLGIIWLISEKLDHTRDSSVGHTRTAASAVEHIETPILSFFMGLLVIVGAAEESGGLAWIAHKLELLGLSKPVCVFIEAPLSAIIDNVAMVAVNMGMYAGVPQDHPLWFFVALSMGIFGSMIVFGSLAGVATMAMKQTRGKLTFGWWNTNVLPPALLSSFIPTLVMYIYYFG